MLGLLPVYALKMLSRHPFQLQAVTPGQSGSRPHAGPLLYERRGVLTWLEFDAATADFDFPTAIANCKVTYTVATGTAAVVSGGC